MSEPKSLKTVDAQIWVRPLPSLSVVVRVSAYAHSANGRFVPHKTVIERALRDALERINGFSNCEGESK